MMRVVEYVYNKRWKLYCFDMRQFNICDVFSKKTFYFFPTVYFSLIISPAGKHVSESDVNSVKVATISHNLKNAASN